MPTPESERSPSHPPANSTLYDRNFFLAAASQTCFVIANTLMAHYARWVEFLGGDVRAVGWVMSIGAILGLFFRPWIGQWINRFGAKRVWIAGFCVFAVGSFGNLAAHDIGPLVFVLRSLVILGGALVFASGLTYVSQIAPVQRQAEAIGIVGIGGFVGMLIGPLLGDLILGADERSRADFWTLFITAGLGNLATVWLVWQLREPPRMQISASVGFWSFAKLIRDYWPGMILVVDLAFGVCMAIPFGFLASYIDQVPLRIEGMSVMGIYFWCYAGSGIGLRIIGRRLPELMGRRKVLLAGMICMAAGLGSFRFVSAQTPWMITLPAVLTGLAHALAFHTMTSLTLAPFPDHVRGTGSALALMMLDLGTICGAPLLAMIADTSDFETMFSVAAVLVLLAGVAYFVSSIPVWRVRASQRAAP